MKTTLEALLQLQELDKHPRRRAVPESADSLRKRIPADVLLHYDRYRARGRKVTATVNNNGVCGGCHVSVTRGLIVALQRGDQIQVCGNCGRYLMLENAPATQAELQHS